MLNIFPFLFPLLLIMFGFSIGFGVNLKKWYGWTQVLASFLFGWLMAWSSPKVTERLILGIFFAVLTISLGPIAWQRRQVADEVVDARARFLNGLRRSHNCPRCGSSLPRFRIPTSVRQLLYGGSRCKQCGCEVDRTGHEIASS